MPSITLDQMVKLQMERANTVYNKCWDQKDKDPYISGLSHIYHEASMRERKKCWPRGKAYRRVCRREMNPHIDFSLPCDDLERYNHMKKRLWAK